MFQKQPTKKIGDCEASHFDGQGVNVEVTLEYGNIWMCAAHKAEQDNLELRDKAAKELMDRFKQVDQSIQLQTDIALAKTIPIIELRGAIYANSDIPDDKKSETFCDACDEHVKRLTQAMFDKRAELQEMGNELRLWQVNGQEEAGKLHEKARAKYTSFRIDYQPEKPTATKVKSATKVKVVKASKSSTKEVREVAAKYGFTADQLQSVCISRNMLAEDAAKLLTEMLK